LVQDIARLRARIDAIVLIEHDMSVVRALADRLLALDAGRLIASGGPAAVLRHPLVIQAYLGDEEGALAGDP
jgi:ABC-type branched-subunit amino acid transport system ATPase component